MSAEQERGKVHRMCTTGHVGGLEEANRKFATESRSPHRPKHLQKTVSAFFIFKTFENYINTFTRKSIINSTKLNLYSIISK